MDKEQEKQEVLFMMKPINADKCDSLVAYFCADYFTLPDRLLRQSDKAINWTFNNNVPTDSNICCCTCAFAFLKITAAVSYCT
jgi:hypothetical protein